MDTEGPKLWSEETNHEALWLVFLLSFYDISGMTNKGDENCRMSKDAAPWLNLLLRGIIT